MLSLAGAFCLAASTVIRARGMPAIFGAGVSRSHFSLRTLVCFFSAGAF
jgi:hypothetical protein